MTDTPPSADRFQEAVEAMKDYNLNDKRAEVVSALVYLYEQYDDETKSRVIKPSEEMYETAIAYRMKKALDSPFGLTPKRAELPSDAKWVIDVNE